METRYLRKNIEGSPVWIYTEILAAYEGIVECDREGNIVPIKAPVQKDGLKQLPLVKAEEAARNDTVPLGVDMTEPEPVEESPVAEVKEEPEEVQEEAPKAVLSAEAAQKAADEISLSETLGKLSVQELRAKLSGEFGEKCPINFTKLQMVERYIDLKKGAEA